MLGVGELAAGGKEVVCTSAAPACVASDGVSEIGEVSGFSPAVLRVRGPLLKHRPLLSEWAVVALQNCGWRITDFTD